MPHPARHLGALWLAAAGAVAPLVSIESARHAQPFLLIPQEAPPPDETWDALVDARLFRLPPAVPRSWVMMDGRTYVLEVRRGAEYRASVIEHTSPPETAGDRVVRAIAALVRRAVPPAW
jgi:hypothetical protein